MLLLSRRKRSRLKFERRALPMLGEYSSHIAHGLFREELIARDILDARTKATTAAPTSAQQNPWPFPDTAASAPSLGAALQLATLALSSAAAPLSAPRSEDIIAANSVHPSEDGAVGSVAALAFLMLTLIAIVCARRFGLASQMAADPATCRPLPSTPKYAHHLGRLLSTPTISQGDLLRTASLDALSPPPPLSPAFPALASTPSSRLAAGELSAALRSVHPESNVAQGRGWSVRSPRSETAEEETASFEDALLALERALDASHPGPAEEEEEAVSEVAAATDQLEARATSGVHDDGAPNDPRPTTPPARLRHQSTVHDAALRAAFVAADADGSGGLSKRQLYAALNEVGRHCPARRPMACSPEPRGTSPCPPPTPARCLSRGRSLVASSCR